jgi:hypothetical protein
MEVNDQPFYPRGNRPRYPLDSKLGRPQPDLLARRYTN